MHNETSVSYYCLRCRTKFSVSVRLDLCIAPLELSPTFKKECPSCGEPAARVPFLGLPDRTQVPLEDGRWLLGRLAQEKAKAAAPKPTYGIRPPVVRDGHRLYFADLTISRQHAAVTHVEEVTYTIEDLGSRGGTYVNDQLVADKTTLQAGDTTRIGKTEIGYCIDPIPKR